MGSLAMDNRLVLTCTNAHIYNNTDICMGDQGNPYKAPPTKIGGWGYLPSQIN